MRFVKAKFIFEHTNRICLYWLFLNCVLLSNTSDCLSEPIDATASSLNIDDSIDQSTSTVQNANNNQETVIANSTGNLINTNDQTYYLSPNELIDNETNSKPIVISNNVSTNKQQTLKPNQTYFDNRLAEQNELNERNKHQHLYNDLSVNNEYVFNYVSPSSNLNPSSNLESAGISTPSSTVSSSSTTIASSSTAKSNKNQYEYLQNNSPNQFNGHIKPIDDLIEFKLNRSTFSEFLDRSSSTSSPSILNNGNLATLSTPINGNPATPTPSTNSITERTNESSMNNEPINSMPELYSSLSSFANTIQKNKLNDKNLNVMNTIPKNMPISINSTSDAIAAANSNAIANENRLRWINNNFNHRNKLPYFPPKQPAVPGIPSGFRNPISQPNTFPPSNNNVLPSGMLNGVSTPPLNSLGTGANTNPANNINLASIVNSLSAPNNLVQPGFGGSSLNQNGFPYPTANNLIGPPSVFATAGYPSNGMINPNLSPEVEAEIEAGLATASNSFSRRPGVNITRVEHIAAECSDDFMKVIISFNGTFTGLVYSSGYVHDQNCIYVNGTGRNGYEFYIRLNQCGTMGREEIHHAKRPGEVRRRDQVMWNTLSIQYNGLIEEEWDEHYRVTCEYGSDYWKTVTFPSFNVEVNTGSPVVFTINPPQCQMEVRRGFGIAGSRTSGPVTVGDPLTLLIHMKSEKAGFDILVKNCISHNGGNQRLQLIDTNGCVTNEKLISPFRGTYNSDDGHQVSLYAYLKAFRFTGSPALYLECDIHMCHNKCPPQRCYWRNLSKRSLSNESYYEQDTEQYGEPFSIGRYNFSLPKANEQENSTGVISESLSLFQALEVRHSDDTEEDYDERSSNNKYERTEFVPSKLAKKRNRKVDALRYLDEFDDNGDQPDNKFCFTGLNLTFVTISTITVLISAISTSILSCLKLRKLRIDYLRYDDRLSAISKSTSSKTAMFYSGGQQPYFSRRY